MTIDIAAGDETAAALSATTRIGGQTLDVAWEAQLADDVEVAVTLSAPDDGGFKIGELAGLGDVWQRRWGNGLQRLVRLPSKSTA